MPIELHENLFYHGKIDRNVAENRLKLCASSLTSLEPDGIFLVRESSCSKEFILSVLEANEVIHYQIRRHYNDSFYSVNDVDVFHGLETLISHYCCDKNSDLILKVSCPGGTSPPLDACRNGKSSLLHRATCQGNFLIVQEILKSRGGCLNAKDQEGRTVLHLACIYGFKKVFDLLVDCEQVHCNIKDVKGFTPLHYACRYNRPDFVSLLLEKGKANPQARTLEKGWVALHEAVFNNANECVCVLLHYGAAVHPRCSSNQTPLDIAKSKDYYECIVLLEQYCSKPDDILLSKQPWYHPEIKNRKKCIELLKKDGSIDGTFMVRTSSKDDEILILSLYFHLQFYHFEILSKDSFYCIDYGPYFETVSMLVTHYCRWDDGLPCILNPCHLIVQMSENTQMNLDTDNLNTVDTLFVKESYVSNNLVYLRNLLKEKIEIVTIEKESLILDSVIGEGEFGCVHKGRWKFEADRNVPVAIKQLHENQIESVKEQFLQEAALMEKLDHVCIVRLYGIAMGPPLLMVQELMQLGSLLDFVTSNSASICLSDIRLWSAQIATGMEYLESRRFVHRDLACRNILLESISQAKISDFGLSRILPDNNQCYSASQGGRWPIKWYAPESINFGTFSHKSDVWSFGVTLWEIFTLGEEPYGDISCIDLSKLLKEGYRLTMPELCPFGTYEKLKQCWCENPADRPSFLELKEYFSTDPEYSNVQTLIDLSLLEVTT